jgi:hypothetical protein
VVAGVAIIGRTVSKFRRAILLVLKAAMERLDELAAKRHLSSDVLGAARA